MLHPSVGGTVIGIGAEHKIVKKKRASGGADALVICQCLDEVAVDAAAWKFYDLFEF